MLVHKDQLEKNLFTLVILRMVLQMLVILRVIIGFKKFFQLKNILIKLTFY